MMVSPARDLFTAFTLLCALPLASAGHALESPWTNVAKAEVRLLAAGHQADGEPLRAGVEIRLAPGWHTYWRYPGDAGVPPRFDWSKSTNVAAVEVRWPAPERIRVEAGLESIGYRGTVVLPLVVRVKESSSAVSLRLKLDIGICESICIPAEAQVALDIPRGLRASVPLLDAAEARVPARDPGKSANLRILATKLERAKTRALVDVAVPQNQPFDLFAEGPSEAWALPLPELIDSGNGHARFAIPMEGAPAGAGPTPASLRLTLVAGGEAIEVVAPLD